MKTIYLVEDDDNLREVICYAFNTVGFTAVGFAEPSAFWAALEKKIPDFFILDIMLPGEDGLSILKKLRINDKTKKLPIVLLTAKGAEYDRIKGLDMGADDYITKPFSVMELISRIKAILRRTDVAEVGELAVGAVTVHPGRRTVTAGGREVSLTYTEFELLQHLARNAGLVLSRDKLMELVWGIDAPLESRTIDMHIKALRQKLGPEGEQIKTVRSIGYKMEAEHA